MLCIQGDVHVYEPMFIHVDKSSRKWDNKNMDLMGLGGSSEMMLGALPGT